MAIEFIMQIFCRRGIEYLPCKTNLVRDDEYGTLYLNIETPLCLLFSA